MIRTDNNYRLALSFFIITAALFFSLLGSAQAEIDIVDRNQAEEVIRGEKDDIPSCPRKQRTPLIRPTIRSQNNCSRQQSGSTPFSMTLDT